MGPDAHDSGKKAEGWWSGMGMAGMAGTFPRERVYPALTLCDFGLERPCECGVATWRAGGNGVVMDDTLRPPLCHPDHARMRAL